MNNVFGYLRTYGKLSFAAKPFCDVDSLLLSQFCYLKLDGLVPRLKENGQAVSMAALMEHPEKEKLFADTRFEKNNRKLFELMASSTRFGSMMMNYYVDIVDKEIETQFCAVTFFLEGARPYIAFRGTDETIIGWKEDFCMAFRGSIPSQDYSVIYVTQIADRIDGTFYVGGHSKGGNLAVYAGLFCAEDIAARIVWFYSFDGPGFRPEVLQRERYPQILPRIRKLVPQSSVIGMMLQTQERYQVVKSMASGLLQHDPFTWLVRDGKFVRSESLYKGRKMLDHAMNEWIISLSEEQMVRFVEDLFDLIKAAEVEDLVAFEQDRKKHIKAFLEAYKGMDAEEKKFMGKLLGKLFRYAFQGEK
ncbi:MAG: DUF2974 domain-containing protein [Clostridium sp.]|nr:DUF2974 domain-containing protein [Clostridium sp.]